MNDLESLKLKLGKIYDQLADITVSSEDRKILVDLAYTISAEIDEKSVVRRENINFKN